MERPTQFIKVKTINQMRNYIKSSKFQTPASLGRKLYGTLEIELYDIKGVDIFDINEVVFIDQKGDKSILPNDYLHFIGGGEFPDNINEACVAHIEYLYSKQDETDTYSDLQQTQAA